MPTSRPTRSYRPETREAVVKAAVVAGGAAVARELAIPRRTVTEWMNRADSAGLALFAQQKTLQGAAAIANRLEDAADSIMQAMVVATTKEEAAAVRDRAVAYGIMVDKLAILSGGKTGGRFGNQEEPAPDYSLLAAAPTDAHADT